MNKPEKAELRGGIIKAFVFMADYVTSINVFLLTMFIRSATIWLPLLLVYAIYLNYPSFISGLK